MGMTIETFMEEIFVKLLNISISASLMILAVVLLRLVIRKAPKRTVCFLWALVAVRLVCPVSFSSPLSAYRLIAPPVTEHGEIEYVHFIGKNMKPLAVVVRDDYEFLKADESADSAKKHNPDLYLPPIVLVWVIGLAGMLFYAGYSAVKLKVSLRDAVFYKENIWMSDAVRSPFIFGVVRPRIYLNSGIKEEQMEYVTAHEWAHIRRWDHIFKPFGYVLLAVYCFNPLCWLAYLLFCKDMELACDESVIKEKSLAWKKTYSATLLECSMLKKQVFACPLAFGEVGVKERVSAVLKYKKPAAWVVALAAVTCLAVAVCFLTIPSKAEHPETASTEAVLTETAADKLYTGSQDAGYEEEPQTIVPTDEGLSVTSKEEEGQRQPDAPDDAVRERFREEYEALEKTYGEKRRKCRKATGHWPISS